MADGNGGGYSNGDGQYRTFMGAGFGTLLVRLAPGRRETPAVASERAYLRGGLPAIYQENDFGMRFVGALEAVLDPIVAVLDALPEHFDPDYAPRDVLALLSAWVGVDVDESLEIRHQRDLLRHAGELGRRRGTKAGLELQLRLAFPDLPLRVEDAGSVRWEGDGYPEQPPATGGSDFAVYCDVPVPEEVQAAIARAIEHAKPVHTTYRLRVKAPRPPAAEGGQ